MRPLTKLIAIVLFSALALGMVSPPLALAQLGGLGGLGGGLGGLPRLPPPGARLPRAVDRATGAVDRATGTVTRQVQQVVDSVGRPPLPDAFERDPQGARVVKSEVLALSPSDQSLATARRLNFDVLRQENLATLNLGITVLRAPPGMSATDALAALRAADPTGLYDFNHVYDPSGEIRVAEHAATATKITANVAQPAIGLIDAGIDRDHPDLKRAKIVTANFTGTNANTPSEHGTAIASLLVASGHSVRGVVPNATLYAADVFGGSPTGGAADAVAQGLAWVSGKGAAVINISLAGPPNRMVEAVVRALVARGCVIVAAAGNTGPATPIAYPAAYDGVIAATSVDREGKIQIDANQGPQMAFAALGVDVPVAALGNGYARATGTSFAAPLIAARFALEMPAPGTESANRALLELAHEAVDLGVPGRDPVFGYGFLKSPPGSGKLSLSSQ
ncbi:MAG TPA: S8 family serine peptidase [Micropepsaceae bacterium]|nr:S8 family serine peptidase [Micropepsaceae bacterium]